MTPEQHRAWSNKKYGGNIGVTERGDAGVHMSEVLKAMPDYTGVILITKNCGLVLPHLDVMDAMHPYGNNKSYMVHCSITGYGGSALEPNVPTMQESIYAYHKLVSKLGGQRVVLRIDPIIPTEKGLEVAYSVLEASRGRVRISFFDAYPHALKRMTPKMREAIAKVYGGSFHAPLELRLSAYNAMQNAMGAQTRLIEVCGEPGLPCHGCVSIHDLKAMGIEGEFNRNKGTQRSACSCIASKKEMLSFRGQCKHGCLYCYWR